MVEFHKIWIEQCEAARSIRESYGTGKALGYLVGEKLINFVRKADSDAEFALELPNFVSEVKVIFDPVDIREYIENVHRLGPLGHVCSDNDYEVFREAGAIEEDPVRGAEDILLFERIKEMLLE